MIELTCQECGKAFSLYPSQVKRGKGKYCSRKCHSDAGRVERICETCGIGFTARASVVKKGWDRYCSAKCYGIAQRSQTGEASRTWRGGRIITIGGYVAVKAPWRTSAKRDGYILEHRMVLEDAIGRPLRSDEVVHHINGDKRDNRLSNLTILTNSEHAALHAAIA